VKTSLGDGPATATLATAMASAPPPAESPITETLPALMREHAISYRALAARTRLVDHGGNGLSHSHLVNLAAGRDLPTRRVLELLASTFKLPPAYFAEYRLAELRRQLDERQVGFDTAYRTYQTLSRRRSARSH
jgi:transcriptional regulator with XRE-family HTH domain